MDEDANRLAERWTDRCRKVQELALREALQLGHNYIGPEHLLLAIIREGESLAWQAIHDRLGQNTLRQAVLERIRYAQKPEETTDYLIDRIAMNARKWIEDGSEHNARLLMESFTTLLTRERN